VGQVLSVDLNSDQNTTVYNGADASVNLRFGQGGSLLAGIASGLSRSRTCQTDDPNGVVESGLFIGSRFCDQGDFDIPFDKNFKLAGSYPMPWGISMSAVFQSVPGAPRTITWVVGRAQVPTLTLSSVTVRLSAPGESYLPRLNQLDLKFSKTVRYQRLKMQPQIGIFNVTNSATVLNANNSFGPSLNSVTSIVDGRVVRLGVQVDF
jgi:hypothetical protein